MKLHLLILMLVCINTVYGQNHLKNIDEFNHLVKLAKNNQEISEELVEKYTGFFPEPPDGGGFFWTATDFVKIHYVNDSILGLVFSFRTPIESEEFLVTFSFYKEHISRATLAYNKNSVNGEYNTYSFITNNLVKRKSMSSADTLHRYLCIDHDGSFQHFTPSIIDDSTDRRYEFASHRLLNEPELLSYSECELKTIAFEIFTCNGYVIDSLFLKELFWSLRSYLFVPESLTDKLSYIEKKNINLIVEWLKSSSQ